MTDMHAVIIPYRQYGIRITLFQEIKPSYDLHFRPLESFS